MKFLHTIALCCALFAALSGRAAEPVWWRSWSEGAYCHVEAAVAPGYTLTASSLTIAVLDTKETLLLPETAPAAPADGEFRQGKYRWRFRGAPPFTVKVDFQCCRAARDGEPALCLMPQSLRLGGETPLDQAAVDAELLPIDFSHWQLVRSAGGMMSETEFLAFLRGGDASMAAGFFGGAGFWMILLLTLAGGLLLNLTPCVLPLIPVNLAILGAAQGERSGWRAGFAYGCGMALAYGIAGGAVVLAGGSMGAWHGSWLFQWSVALLFLFFALSMAGVFQLDFTRFRALDKRKVRGGHLAAAFVSGAVAALLAGACVAPVVLGVLLFAGERYQEGERWALFLPFLLGVGMALPWSLAGAGLGVLPRPGSFMVKIKYAFAVLLFGMAAWYLWQGWLLLPGKGGSVASWERLERAMDTAEKENRPLLVEFGASWCKNCAAMKKTTLANSAVRKELAERWVVCDFQAENPGDPAVAALFQKWKVKGVPAFVILKRAR